VTLRTVAQDGRDPAARSPTVRLRIDFGGRCSVGIGKIELLETIARTGSLSRAARAMRMSYRRAWLLLEDLNTSFDRRVATTTTGGRGGGGAELTEFGGSLVVAYRDLEARLGRLAAARLRDLGAHANAAQARGALRPPSLSRRSAHARSREPAPPRRRAAPR